MSNEDVKQDAEQVEEHLYDIRIDPKTGREHLVVRWAGWDMAIVQVVALGIVNGLLYFSLDIQVKIPPANIDTWAFLGVNFLGVFGIVVFMSGRTWISVDGKHVVIYRGPFALPPRHRRVPLSQVVKVIADERFGDHHSSKGFWIVLELKNGKQIRLLTQQPSEEAKDIIERFIVQSAARSAR